MVGVLYAVWKIALAVGLGFVVVGVLYLTADLPQGVNAPTSVTRAGAWIYSKLALLWFVCGSGVVVLSRGRNLPGQPSGYRRFVRWPLIPWHEFSLHTSHWGVRIIWWIHYDLSCLASALGIAMGVWGLAIAEGTLRGRFGRRGSPPETWLGRRADFVVPRVVDFLQQRAIRRTGQPRHKKRG